MQNKIISVQFYQAVKINGTLQRYCRSAEYLDVKVSNAPTIKMHEHGVLIESPTQLLLVGWPNLSEVEFDKNSVMEALEEKPTKAGTKKTTDFRNI